MNGSSVRIHAVQPRCGMSASDPAAAVRQRRGRKLVITPDGETQRPRRRIDSALVKAIARAHRWQRMLENGDYSSLTDLAAAEKINLSYMSRVLRLTLLAPELVEAILDGRQLEGVSLPALMRPFRWGAITHPIQVDTRTRRLRRSRKPVQHPVGIDRIKSGPGRLIPGLDHEYLRRPS